MRASSSIGRSQLIRVFYGPEREEAVTPDGIAGEDWDRVHQLALDVVNLSTDGDTGGSASATLRLRELLDELQRKYGPLPSLLATRADYVERIEEREYWLLAAYEQAVARRDPKNLVLIAASLAALFIDDLRDTTQGTNWVERLELHLQDSPDASEAEEASRLRGLLTSL